MFFFSISFHFLCKNVKENNINNNNNNNNYIHIILYI